MKSVRETCTALAAATDIFGNDEVSRLIGAAPDLLDALIRCAKCLEALDGTETAEDLRDIFDQAAAAITKAQVPQ